MNKQELSWFVVRLIGVGLVLNGMRYVAIVIENILNMPKRPRWADAHGAVIGTIG